MIKMKSAKFTIAASAVIFLLVFAVAAVLVLSNSDTTARAEGERTVYLYSARDDGEIIGQQTLNAGYSNVAWKSCLDKLPLKPETRDGVDGAYRFKEWVYADGTAVAFGSDGYITIDSGIVGDVNVYATYGGEWEPYAAEVQKIVDSAGTPLDTPSEPVRYTRIEDAFDHYFGYGCVVKLLDNVTINRNLNTNWTVGLDLNGKTLSSSGFETDYMISVNSAYQSSCGFTVKDSSGTGDGKIAGAKNGAIYHAAGRRTLTIEGGTITANEGEAAVYVSNYSSYDACTLVIAGGRIDGNSTVGVKVNRYAHFNMTGGSISGNKASDGGGVYFDAYGNFDFSGGEISGNNCGAQGGGIYVTQRTNAQGNITMSDGARVVGNSSYNSGGGIYVGTPCNFVMNGGTIEGNTSTDASGGGVCVSGSDAVFDMRGGTIAHNTAKNYGSGAYSVYGGKIKISGGVITQNTANKNSYGGGVAFSSNSFFELSGNANITGNVKGVAVEKNDDGTYSLGEGDATACNVLLGSKQQITIVGELSGGQRSIGISFSSYYDYKFLFTQSYKTNNPSGNGIQFFADRADIGGVNFCNGELTFADVFDVTFVVDGERTVIEVISGSSAVYPQDNPAKPSDDGGEYKFDGWSESENGDKVSTSNVVKNMTLYPHFSYAPYVATVADVKYTDLGNAFDAADNGTVKLISNAVISVAPTVATTVTLDLNGFTIDRALTSARADGYAIYVNGGNLTVKDTSDEKIGAIKGGYTSGRGGGINVNGGALILESGNITGNKATYYGGGVYISGGTFTMTGGSIFGNIAGDNGGGVYVTGGTFSMTGGTINGNKATCRGGGVYVQLSDSRGEFIMNGGTISSNTANSNSDSKYGGGGVYLEKARMTLNNGNIIKNESYMSGGGIMLYSAASLNMSGGEISQNKLMGSRSQYAGGVFMYYGCDFTMSGGEITDNDNNGVRLQFNGSSPYKENLFSMSGDAKIGGNGDEGIFINGGTATMQGGSIEGNYGGVYILSGAFDMRGGSIKNNLIYTSIVGGGIYVYQSDYTTLKISGGSVVKDNYFRTSETSIVKSTDGTYAITGGKDQCNVYLESGEIINIADSLTCGKGNIGVTLGSDHGGVATDGYTSVGGGTDGKEFFSDAVGKLATVSNGEVKFAQAVTVVFMDGDTEICRKTVLSGENVEYSLDSTEKTDDDGIYAFVKWTTEKDGDTEAVLNGVTSDMTVYAKWSFMPYVAAIGEDKYTDFNVAVNNATDGQTVKMLSEVLLSECLLVQKRFTLDLNGHTLGRDGNVVILVQGVLSEFTLADSAGGGKVTGGSHGVTVDYGKFYMTGGTICANACGSGENGGGVYVNGGTFTMSGGVISDNSADYGGGVYVGSGTFKMTGGAISKNSAVQNGSGVYVYDGAVFELSGAVVIFDNKKKNGATDNVCTAVTINISGALTDGISNAQIGLNVCKDTATSSYGVYNKKDGKVIKPSTYFKQDGGGCVKLDKNIEVCVTYSPTSHSYVYSSNGDTHIGTCSDCGSTSEAQTHSSDDIPTCAQKKKCDVCGAEFGEYDLNNHDFDMSVWTADSDGHYHACSNGCGIKTKDFAVHGGNDDGNCETAVLCSVCGNTIKDANTHDFSGAYMCDETQHWHVCVNEGCTQTDTKISHSGGEATCSAKAECSLCGAEYGAINIDNHDPDYSEWKHDVIGHYRACRNGCGTSLEYTRHTYDRIVVADEYLKSSATCLQKAVYYKSCICGHADKLGDDVFEYGELGVHDTTDRRTENGIPATCIAFGSYDNVFYCSACGKEQAREHYEIDINPDAHSYGAWQAEVSADCTHTGTLAHKDCVLCGRHFNRSDSEISDLTIATNDVHLWNDGTVTTVPTCINDGEIIFTCAHNNTHIKRDSIAALGHDYGAFTVDKAATCTESGIKSRHCAVCGEKTEITVISPVPHALTHHEKNDATAETDGNTEYWECDGCNKFFVDPTGETEISDKSSVIIPKIANDNENTVPSDDSAVCVTLVASISVVILLEIGYIVLRKTGKIKFKGDE